MEQYEILYVRRNYYAKDPWSAHLAFPGGRNEPLENAQQTAEREVFEEVGLQLKSPDFKLLGRLDDREVRNKLSTKCVMVLSAFVYLQTRDETPAITLQNSEVASCYWVPISYLTSDSTPWHPVKYSLSTILFHNRVPRIDNILNRFIGNLSFFGIPIPAEFRYASSDSEMSRLAIDRQFPLWGLTLWMTSDLLKLMGFSNIASKGSPRYSAPDTNFVLRLLALENKNPYLGTVEYRWGLSTQSAIRIAIFISIGLRFSLAYKSFSIIKRVLTSK